MRLQQWFGSVVLAGIATVATLSSGCAKKDAPKGTSGKTEDKKSAKLDLKKDDHSAWWCQPHGIPEEMCSLCLDEADVKKMFKDKGDWCKEHDRAKSQCFICDPSLREKYAATYRAKNGKEPPEPTENMPKKEEKKSK